MRMIAPIKYFFQHRAGFNCMEVLSTLVKIFHQFCRHGDDDFRWSIGCIKRVSSAIIVGNSALVRGEITLITQ